MTGTAEVAVKPLITAEQIRVRVAELAGEISNDLEHVDHPLLLGVLTGAWVFMADLARALELEAACDFIRLSSYGNSERSSGIVHIETEPRADCRGRNVLVVEDIIDTGLSVERLCAWGREQGVAQMRICTLLDKPARRIGKVKADYIGFEIADHFVVGYGMDWQGRCRHLPWIGVVRNTGFDSK